MKRNFRFYLIIWIILLAIFQVIVFVTPNEVVGISKFDDMFWIGYSFIMITFIGQLVCAYFAFKAGTREKFFLNLPLITVSYTALIVSVIVGTVCMIIPNLPNWVGGIICVLVLGISGIAVVSAKATAEAVIEVEDKVNVKTLFIKSLTIDAESLLKEATTDEMRGVVKKVYEAVRYSDPMSNPALADIESQITVSFNNLMDAVKSGTGQVESISDEILNLLNNRNKKCKSLK